MTATNSTSKLEALKAAVKEAIIAEQIDDHPIRGHNIFTLAYNLWNVDSKLSVTDLGLWAREYMSGGGGTGWEYDDLHARLVTCYDIVKFPKDAVKKAIERADARLEPLPEVASRNKGYQRLAAVCYELQRITAPHPFHIGHTAAGEIAGRDKTTGGDYLRMLVKLGILELVKVGTNKGVKYGPNKDLASEYRYLIVHEEKSPTVSQYSSIPSSSSLSSIISIPKKDSLTPRQKAMKEMNL